MCVNISRTFLEASASLMAPSGRVPFAGAAVSSIAISGGERAGFKQARNEMEDTLNTVQRNSVECSRFANTRRKNESQDSAARFFVGSHGLNQCWGSNLRPGGQRPETPHKRDDTRNIFCGGQTDFVAEKTCSHNAPGHRFAVLVAAILS